MFEVEGALVGAVTVCVMGDVAAEVGVPSSRLGDSIKHNQQNDREKTHSTLINLVSIL